MVRLVKILGLFLFLIVNCQPSATEEENHVFSGKFKDQDVNENTRAENFDTHPTHSSSVITDSSYINNPKGNKPTNLGPSRSNDAAAKSLDSSSLNGESNQYSHKLSRSSEPQQVNMRIVDQELVSDVAKHDHVNQKYDQSGLSRGVRADIHEKSIHNTQHIPPTPSFPHPGMANGHQPSRSGQSHDSNFKDSAVGNRLPQGHVTGVNQPPPKYFHDKSGHVESDRGPEVSERPHFHDSRDSPFRYPSDNIGSSSQWEAGEQISPHDRPQKPRRNILPEYQLDETFSLPSREDPTQNHADFVSLVVIVPPGVKHCYFYKPITNFEVEYQVLKGGHLDIGIFIRDPEGEPIAVRPPLSDSQVSISVPKYFRLMPYAICLDNRKASYAYKNVYFSVDVNLNWDNPSELERQAIETLRNNALVNSQAQAANAEHEENIVKLMAQLDIIFGRLRRIEHMQQRSSNFDSADKSLMEGNLERITTGSLFQVALMIAVATIQVGLIRSLFDQRSYLYKIWTGNGFQNLNTRC
ncbi:unnamed protein product [Schistosoma turkestanicum]|nr:unnamed protein product [Schistosoma turkestanicum]